jgi:HemY protein
MRALFWLLTLAALAVGLALAARYNEGYVLLVLPPWRAEVSLNLFLLAAIGRLFRHLPAGARRQPYPGPAARGGAVPRASAAGKGRACPARRLAPAAGRALRPCLCVAPKRSATIIRAPGCWRWPAGAPHMPCVIRRVRRNGRRACAATTAAGLQAARLMTEAEFALEDRRFDDAREALQQFAARRAGISPPCA